jgi:hypothetical protein
MNEHTWEKLDADMRSDMADEYIQERCPHEDLYVNNITVKVQSQPVADLDNWKRFLAKNGTELFELYVNLVCEKCGATQEQCIDIDEILQIEPQYWEWEE